MEDSSLNVGAAAIAGLIGGFAAISLVMAMLALWPRRFPLHPLYLVGSIFSIDTTPALLSGLALVLAVSAGYGIVLAGLLAGLEAASLIPLWGAVVGAALSIVTGTSLAYLRVVSPAVRKGLVGDPGPFLVRYGGWSLAQLIASHALFGAAAGALYDALI